MVLAPRPLCLALAGDLRNGGEGYFHLVAEVVGKLVLLLNYLDERQKWLGRGDSEDEDDESYDYTVEDELVDMFENDPVDWDRAYLLMPESLTLHFKLFLKYYSHLDVPFMKDPSRHLLFPQVDLTTPLCCPLPTRPALSCIR